VIQKVSNFSTLVVGLNIDMAITVTITITWNSAIYCSGIKTFWRKIVKKPSFISVSTQCLKKRPTLSLSVSSPNINQFSKFFHWHILCTICNNTVTEYPTTPLMCRYTTLWNINFQKSLWSHDTVSDYSVENAAEHLNLGL